MNKCVHCGEQSVALFKEGPVCYTHTWGPDTTLEQSITHIVAAVREIQDEIESGRRKL